MPDRIVPGELQIESRHPLIETERDALILIGIAPVDLVIDMSQLLYCAKGKHRHQSQGRLRVRLQKTIADQQLIDLGGEDDLLREDDPSDTVDRARALLDREFADILMPIWAQGPVMILMHSEVKLRPVLDHRLIHRREEDGGIRTALRRHHQEPVILTRIASHDRRAVVGSTAIGMKKLPGKRSPQVGHYATIKLLITHILCYIPDVVCHPALLKYFSSSASPYCLCRVRGYPSHPQIYKHSGLRPHFPRL